MPTKHCLLLNNLIASKFQYAKTPHTNIAKKKIHTNRFFFNLPYLDFCRNKKNRNKQIWKCTAFFLPALGCHALVLAL